VTLDEIFRQRAETWSDIYEHVPFLHVFVVERNAQTVVELGVRSGNSTAPFLAAMEKTGGHLYSVDINVPSWPIEFYGRDFGTLIVGDDLDPKVAAQLPEQIDVLFIDTSHHYQHTLDELRLYGPRSTAILLHDTELEHPYAAPATDPPFPVKVAMIEWCAEVGRSFTNRENCNGLGIIGG
jgi:predicted O-methyltransferase YrrM